MNFAGRRKFDVITTTPGENNAGRSVKIQVNVQMKRFCRHKDHVLVFPLAIGVATNDLVFLGVILVDPDSLESGRRIVRPIDRSNYHHFVVVHFKIVGNVCQKDDGGPR
jgi:hypothetical protein